MNIDHVHFYVEDAEFWRDWFVQILGFHWIESRSSVHTRTELIESGTISFRLSSPLSPESPVAQYLHRHPPGVSDVAFHVTNLEAILERADTIGVAILQPIQHDESATRSIKTAQVQGWGDLKHTLIETEKAAAPVRSIDRQRFRSPSATSSISSTRLPTYLTGIDHIVLNVAIGELEPTIAYYESLFCFQRQQSFSIRTDRSALCSQVLKHPNGTVQLPINEPASSGSQIQEFLDLNRGAGIQHIALQTADAVETIAQLRQRGLPFLTVPATYYDQLQQRSGFLFADADWQRIQAQEILVDWKEDPQAALLQAFTHPIFEQPTFFFELIERRAYWKNQSYRQAQGFGEGNFQALFEAIEREQMKRGSLR